MKKLPALLILFSVFWTLVPINSFATSSAPITSTIILSSNMPGYQKFDKNYVRSLSLSVPQIANHKVKSWTVTKNNLNKGQLGVYDEATKK